jgi:hypothetical protein
VSGGKKITRNQIQVLHAILGLVTSLQDTDKDGHDFESKLRSDLSAKYSEIDERLGEVSNEVNETFSTVGKENLKASIARAQYVDNLISEIGPELEAKENELNGFREKLEASLKKSGRAFGSSKASQYSLQGTWNRLSSKTQSKLATLIDLVRRGQLTIEEAITASRKIDVSEIESADQAVQMLINGVLAYQRGVHEAFDGVGDMMKNVTDYVNATLDSVGTDLFVKLYGVQDQEGRVRNMMVSLHDLSDNTSLLDRVQTLQNEIQSNQTMVSNSITEIGDAIDQFEAKLNKQENDYENFVQDAIAKASSNVKTRGIELRRKLGLNDSNNQVN